VYLITAVRLELKPQKTNYMRKLIYTINQTLDGCFNHDAMTAPDAEAGEYSINLVRNAGALIYGRKTYQLMVPYWPDAAKDKTAHKSKADFAEAFCAIDQMVVVSETLDRVEGKNTVIIRSNLYNEVLKLKQQEGKYVLTGGVDVPSQLIQLGLVDEYHTVVHPVFAGKGKRLFENAELAERLKLRLVETKVFKSGCVLLVYAKG